MRYTKEQLQQSADYLASGLIGKHTMSRKEYSALRRRLNYHGFKKPDFMITKKMGKVIETQQRRQYMRQYMRLYRRSEETG
jgi:hypothetical protein